MSPTGMIVIASAVLVQGGMMGVYINLAKKSKEPSRRYKRDS